MNAHVESTALKAAKGGCNICIHELKQASRDLKAAYQNAGAGWRDKQYVRLGGIIEECCDALEKPVDELEDCVSSLDDMMKLIERFETEGF